MNEHQKREVVVALDHLLAPVISGSLKARTRTITLQGNEWSLQKMVYTLPGLCVFVISGLSLSEYHRSYWTGCKCQIRDQWNSLFKFLTQAHQPHRVERIYKCNAPSSETCEAGRSCKFDTPIFTSMRAVLTCYHALLSRTQVPVRPPEKRVAYTHHMHGEMLL